MASASEPGKKDALDSEVKCILCEVQIDSELMKTFRLIWEQTYLPNASESINLIAEESGIGLISGEMLVRHFKEHGPLLTLLSHWSSQSLDRMTSFIQEAFLECFSCLIEKVQAWSRSLDYKAGPRPKEVTQTLADVFLSLKQLSQMVEVKLKLAHGTASVAISPEVLIEDLTGFPSHTSGGSQRYRLFLVIVDWVLGRSSTPESVPQSVDESIRLLAAELRLQDSAGTSKSDSKTDAEKPN
jgi:NTP pyrophosphatase (non-canonical NTP hydrolase)